MNSDSGCKHFFCLVLNFAMTEKHSSHKFDDPSGNKAELHCVQRKDSYILHHARIQKGTFP
jgi:hypothetical protein